jgi:surfeit locus 1 family protein
VDADTTEAASIGWRLYSAPTRLHNAAPDFWPRSGPPLLRLEIGNSRLKASWPMTALAVAGVLLFVQLGRWQWHRAEEKRVLEASYAAAGADFASELGTRATTALPRYAQVRMHGRYDAAHQFLLDNMSHGGQAGYQVLTPFRLDDGRLLLVNRGWVPLPEGRRDRLPELSLPDEVEVNIGGRLDTFPAAAIAAGTVAPAADPTWPKRTSYPTASQLGQALGQPVDERQLLLGEGEPNGYVRDWHEALIGFGPQRHVAYALQWWALAALITYLYLYMNLEMRP